MTQRYRTIVADPPWPYPEGFADGGPNHLVNGEYRPTSDRSFQRTALPYPSLSLGEIEALPVSELAESDARLFLWATSRYLPAAHRCVEAWRFQYRQMLVWDKTPNFPPLSGGVASIAAEFLLVASRGAPGMLSRWPTSVIRARKPRSEHSRKPDVFLDLVESVSPPPYCELFARRNRLGWDTFGDEALEHVDLEAS